MKFINIKGNVPISNKYIAWFIYFEDVIIDLIVLGEKYN